MSRNAPFRIWAAVALAACTIGALAITLWPSHVDAGARPLIERIVHALHRLGAPDVLGYAQIEFAANVLMLVPIGLLLTVILGARRWWLATAAGLAFSVVVELTQLLVLEGRTASVLDVMANTLGALLGAIIGVLVDATTARRRRMTPSETP